MNSNRKNPGSVPAVGGSSLLVIFAVLCLTVFALLSMSTVKGDTNLRQKSAEAIEEYYAADSQAEEMLARIRNGEVPAGVKQDGNQYSYECRINSTSILCVELTADGSDYAITRWQTVSTFDWQPDTGITVWDGE